MKSPGCWQYCSQYINKHGEIKPIKYYSRRCHTGYDTVSYKGPSGHPKAQSFAGVLFTQKAPGWLFVDQSLRHGKGPKCCPYRCKGQPKGKPCYYSKTVTPSSSLSSKSVIPAISSFEDVIAIRKTMAFYDPKNFKKSRKFRRSCCKIT